ncbi:hypothetical protein H6F55_13205 [Phormidium sp. FACHB-322]|uniref:hypothetical protein n=1 Tax=Phormidium sp. FACHB-322 TaxID=2692849 RepID=UPI00168BAA4A|nr:hypothetical protein [Phormidium sp. FACHB-322]MBD2030946.1 hypothetical protein [Phormidium sp. FACHB-322]
MTSVIPVPLRREIVRRHEAGETLSGIAQQLKLSVWGVRKIWRQYRDKGEAGLAIRYQYSGRSGPRGERLIYRAAVWLKRRHPRWGAGLIRVLLAERYPQAVIPHQRTLQRWFRQQRLSVPPMRHPPVERHRAERVHEVWQLDVTSHQRLADGTPVSWLSLIDEHSGAVLESRAFPPIRL